MVNSPSLEGFKNPCRCGTQGRGILVELALLY